MRHCPLFAGCDVKDYARTETNETLQTYSSHRQSFAEWHFGLGFGRLGGPGPELRATETHKNTPTPTPPSHT